MTNSNKIFFFTAIFLAWSVISVAQTKKPAPKGKMPEIPADPGKAKSLFNDGVYKEALPIYLELVKKKPDNLDYQAKAGICYLNTNTDRSKAIQHLEAAIKTDKPDKDLYFELARAYHYGHRWDDAIKYYNKYKEVVGEKGMAKLNRYIETCNNGKQLMQFPQDVSFENLGNTVNSEWADYTPFIPSTEAFVLFSSRRSGTNGGTTDKNGDFTSDIFISEVKNGQWGKVKNIGGNINTPYNEELAGISPDGKTIFLYIDNAESSGIGDIFMATAKTKVNYERPLPLDYETINTAKYFEVGASISRDGNLLYFSTDREGGIGQKDIYISQRVPTGGWGTPKNIGSGVNSPYNEDYPFITEDGKTLYFSSEGHNSIGGYDIFKSVFIDSTQTWGPAENIGFPINTAYDNLNYCISNSGRDAYVSAIRPDGLGDYDIYKVTFNEIDPKYTIFKGFLTDKDSVKLKTDAFITIYSRKTNDLFGNYPVSGAKNGKYLFYLPPGIYDVEIEADGFSNYKREIEVKDKSAFKDEIQMNLILLRPGETNEPSKVPSKTPAKPSPTKPGAKTTTPATNKPAAKPTSGNSATKKP